MNGSDRPPTIESSAKGRLGTHVADIVTFLRPIAVRGPNAVLRAVQGRALEAGVNQVRQVGRRPYLASFLLLVLAPAFLSTVYFAFVAADLYQSEARFVVRSVEADVDDPARAGSATSGSFTFTMPAQNAYIVTNYIRSRAVLDEIGPNLDIREIFRRPEADFFSRLKKNATIDELTRYWNSMVEANIDAVSGIVVVRVTAFRPEDALTLGRAIVAQSEKLVNRVSETARRDATAYAEKEVRRAFADVQTQLNQIREFRNKSSIIDPGQAGAEIAKMLIPLMAEKLKLETELSVGANELAYESSSLRMLRNRITSLNDQVLDLRRKLTGVDDKTLAAALTAFEELDIQRQLAERFYIMAEADLERANQRANRKAIYFSTFVAPALAEYAQFPKRLYNSIVLSIVYLVLWSIGAMIAASIEDHRL